MALAAASAFSCGATSYVYEGRLYRADRDLATVSSVDVVEGEPAGQCPPVCLVQDTGHGGKAVYVRREQRGMTHANARAVPTVTHRSP
jgi:hypothetical protein